MLSFRVLLTTALLGLLLMAPGIAASSLEDHFPPASLDPLPDPDQAADDVDAARADAQNELDGQGIDSDTSDEKREGYESVRSARRQAGAYYDELDGALGTIRTTVDDASQNPPAVPDLPTAEVPDLFGPEGGDSGSESMAPQSASTAGWDVPAEPLMVLAASTVAAAGLFFWLAGSSGTLGGAAAGAGSTAAAEAANRKFLPFASPLFTRFEKDTVLDHPKREGIYGMIVMKPGVTLQDLCDGTGLSRTAVSHHLRLMEQQHLVVSKRVGRSRHFFENGGRYGRDQKDAYAVLHNDRSKEVHGYIETNPGAIQKDLCEALGIQASVAHWHVKRLVDANLIEAIRQGRTVSYFPNQSLRSVAA